MFSDMNDDELWFWLSSLEKAGPVSLFPLLAFFGKKAWEETCTGISAGTAADESIKKRPVSEIPGSKVFVSDNPNSKETISETPIIIEESYRSAKSYLSTIDPSCPDERIIDLYRKGARLLFEAGRDEIEMSGLCSAAKAAHIANHRDETAVHYGYQRLSAMGVRMISYINPDYPKRLCQLYDPPLCLFVKGKLPKEGEPLMAVVGARSCSEYGRNMTRILSRTLALSGISIISGMARGIDSAAHKGCLDAGRQTYAVMGCGADICYPPGNQELYRMIIENGGILSEYPPGIQPLAWRFPMRNRLIAALSQGITVIEARQRSGSLITAERGLELGREIYAVPGRMDDPLSRGCNDLIQAGAQIVTDPAAILEDFGLTIRRTAAKALPKDRLQRKVLSHVTLIPQTADEIAVRAKEPARDIMAVLISLEMTGYVHSVGKNQYVLEV